MTAPARPTETAEIHEAIVAIIEDSIMGAQGSYWARVLASEIVDKKVEPLFAQRDAALAERDEAREAFDANWRFLERINNWAVQHDQFEVRHEGGPEEAAENIIDLAEGFKAQRDAVTAQAERTAGELAAAKAALKLCLEELEWQTNQTHTCGDPGFECPMQDIHNPDDGHRIARDAAHAALTEEPPHAE